MTTLRVSFGPSRSPSFSKALALAERDATECQVFPDGEVVATFHLSLEDVHALGTAARLVNLVEHWRSTDIEIGGEPEAPWLVVQMALCARDYARRFGRCTWHDQPGNWLLPKCRICPLCPEDAIEQPDIVMEISEESLRPDLDAALLIRRSKPVLPPPSE